MLELLVSIRIISMRTIIKKQDIKKKKRIFFETPSACFMASLSEIKIMHAAGFQGPISMHFEYKIKDNDAVIEEVRKTTATLRGYLKEAGFA